MDGITSLIIFGSVLGMLESTIIPPIMPMRIGLANISTLIAVIAYGTRGGIKTTAYRSLIVGAATGGLLSLSTIFSLSGGLASACAMSLIALLPVSIVTISAVGGLASIVVQLSLFSFVGDIGFERMLVMAQWLAFWGLASGVAVGVATQTLVHRRKLRYIV